MLILRIKFDLPLSRRLITSRYSGKKTALLPTKAPLESDSLLVLITNQKVMRSLDFSLGMVAFSFLGLQYYNRLPRRSPYFHRMPCRPFQERLRGYMYKTILNLTLLFVALFRGIKWYWYQRNRKAVRGNKFRVIREFLQSLDYALTAATHAKSCKWLFDSTLPQNKLLSRILEFTFSRLFDSISRLLTWLF